MCDIQVLNFLYQANAGFNPHLPGKLMNPGKYLGSTTARQALKDDSSSRLMTPTTIPFFFPRLAFGQPICGIVRSCGQWGRPFLYTT